MSRVIGLTGGIACGKSHLSRALGEAGAVIIDADRISYALTARDGKALPQLRQTFGDGIFRDGGLDRRALGELVFSDPEALARLDRLMHPLILAGIREELQAARDGGAAVIVLDAPLLYETGLDQWCDEVWCAWLPRTEQLGRLMARDGLSRKQALRRMASQMSAWQKRLKADRVIDTRGTMAESRQQVLRLYEEVLKKEGQHGETA